MSKSKGGKLNRLLDLRHTVRSLERENRILRAELQRLSKVIKSNNEPFSNSKTASVLQIEKESMLLDSTSYMKYLVSSLTGGSLFSLSKKAMGYFRKFKLVGTIMRVLSSVLTILGTGAFFIFISGALVFIIPLVVAFSAALYFFGATARKKAFRDIKSALKNSSVYVLFPSADSLSEALSPIKSTVDFISNDTTNENFIIIVSPCMFSSIGILSRSPYTVARFERNNLCIIRRHSFFLLRKRVLGPIQNNITYIY